VKQLYSPARTLVVYLILSNRYTKCTRKTGMDMQLRINKNLDINDSYSDDISRSDNIYPA